MQPKDYFRTAIMIQPRQCCMTIKDNPGGWVLIYPSRYGFLNFISNDVYKTYQQAQCYAFFVQKRIAKLTGKKPLPIVLNDTRYIMLGQHNDGMRWRAI